MDIITTARRFEITPEVREHTRKRLEKLERYMDGVEEAHLVLTTEKYRQIAELSVHVRGTEISSREQSDDMLTSIDRVVGRAERQLRRFKARRKDHKGRRRVSVGAAAAEAQAVVEAQASAASETEAPVEEIAPVVVREESFHREPINVERAIELLSEEERDFLLFANARSGAVALVYVRPDGGYGLVEANG